MGRGSEKIAALKTVTDGRSAGSRMLDGGELRSTKRWALAAKPAQTFQQELSYWMKLNLRGRLTTIGIKSQVTLGTQTHLFKPY